nr:zinc finger CCCH domain-containing protein 49-like [Tanacetum cinerariifolium]
MIRSVRSAPGPLQSSGEDLVLMPDTRKVRDTTLSINSNDAIPKSDVNKEYFAEEHDRRVKDNQEKDKIGSKPDKNGKRGEAEKSQKQLQLINKEKLKKMQIEGPKMHSPTSYIKERKSQGLLLQFHQSSIKGGITANVSKM